MPTSDRDWNILLNSPTVSNYVAAELNKEKLKTKKEAYFANEDFVSDFIEMEEKIRNNKKMAAQIIELQKNSEKLNKLDQKSIDFIMSLDLSGNE